MMNKIFFSMLALSAMMLLPITENPAAADSQTDLALGQRIYREGILPNGAPLIGRRNNGVTAQGKDAACENCHRRSGMGGSEGKFLVPSITGPVLFSKPQNLSPIRPGREPVKSIPLRHLSREAYDHPTLAHALRNGIDSSGRPLSNELMPLFDLDDNAMSVLDAYLRQLSASAPPGVEENILHVATIITPDADETSKQTLLKTLVAWSGRMNPRGRSPRLHVWELRGSEDQWTAQLERYYGEQPVYAVLSGVGGANWAPVGNFCESARVPCLFPILDKAPADNAAPFYSLYFSAGVQLEAQILARHLSGFPRKPARIVQIYADDAGRAASRTFEAAIVSTGIPTESRSWNQTLESSLPAGLNQDDVLIAWLRPPELHVLAKAHPMGVASGKVFFSGQLAPPEKLDLPLPWKQSAQWASARSDSERLRGRTILGLIPWLARMGLELDNEPLQSDIYAAIFFFGDALAQMQGHMSREYLLEKLELTVNNRPAGASYYHLSLGAGQRFAAKGGRLLGFVPPRYDHIAPLSERIVP